LLALAFAAPVDDKKPAEKIDDKQAAAADEKKPAEASKGLQWPLPDPDNEGDLMLYGHRLFVRVEELYKNQLDKDEDKMILSVGREYLRRVLEFIQKTTDFKISPVLCGDSERLNSTKRWEIRSRPANQRNYGQPWIEGFFLHPFYFEAAANGEQQNDASQPKDTKQNDPIVPSNSTNATTTDIPVKERPNFEAVNKEYYKRMGDNFARVLMKRYRQEKMEQEEIDYLDRWLGEESIHYGMMGIYCHDGQNVEEITKRINTLIEIRVPV